MPFGAGEGLEYQVKCGPFRVGSMELAVLGIESLQGEACYHLAATLEVSLSPSWLFRARYEQESWCRVADMVTLRSCKRTRESRYQAEWLARFDPDSARVVYSDGQSFVLLPQSRDLLTVWYYLRSRRLLPGSSVLVNCHADRRNYHVEASVAGRRRVRVPAGGFDCLLVTTTGPGPLGRMLLSDDTRRLPVSIETRLGGLTITALLERACAGQRQVVR